MQKHTCWCLFIFALSVTLSLTSICTFPPPPRPSIHTSASPVTTPKLHRGSIRGWQRKPNHRRSAGKTVSLNGLVCLFFFFLKALFCVYLSQSHLWAFVGVCVCLFSSCCFCTCCLYRTHRSSVFPFLQEKITQKNNQLFDNLTLLQRLSFIHTERRGLEKSRRNKPDRQFF